MKTGIVSTVSVSTHGRAPCLGMGASDGAEYIHIICEDPHWVLRRLGEIGIRASSIDLIHGSLWGQEGLLLIALPVDEQFVGQYSTIDGRHFAKAIQEADA